MNVSSQFHCVADTRVIVAIYSSAVRNVFLQIDKHNGLYLTDIDEITNLNKPSAEF
jgi:hypothetical protein